VSDIVEEIDKAIGCHWCEGSLESSVSDLFCGERCQGLWSAERAEAWPPDEDEERPDMTFWVNPAIFNESGFMEPAINSVPEGTILLWGAGAYSIDTVAVWDASNSGSDDVIRVNTE
jgi:hypothetical protein